MRPSLRLLFFSPDFGLELQLSGSKPTAPSIYLLVKRRLELSNEFGQQLPQSTTQSTTVESCLPVGGVGTRLVDTDRHLLRLHNTRGSTQCRSPVLPSACLQRWARIDCCAWRFHFHIPRSRSLPLASSLAPCRCCSLVRPLKLGKHKHAHTHTQTQISILLRLSATSFFLPCLSSGSHSISGRNCCRQKIIKKHATSAATASNAAMIRLNTTDHRLLSAGQIFIDN